MLIQRKFLPAVLACGLAAVGNLFGAGFESPGAPDPSGANASVPGSRKWNEEEKEKCEALVEEDIRQVGEQNPKTLTDKVALAVAKSRTGESLAAENELRDLLAIYQRRQGPDHEETISCRTALAQLLKETRRPHEAVTEYRAVLEIRERTLGADDVEVARIKHLMADAHSSADEYPAAIALYRESQPIFERVLGPENAESLLNRSNLALALGQNREFAACEKDLRELLSIRERLQGPDSAQALMTCFELGRALAGDNQLEEADRYAQRAEEGLTTVLGADNPQTILAGKLHREIEFDLRRLASKYAPPSNLSLPNPSGGK